MLKKCVSNKKMYATQALAEDVLIELRSKFHYSGNSGPVNVYQCDDCGYFHLTSKGVLNEKLARYITDGKINLQQEANRWMGKFKKY